MNYISHYNEYDNIDETNIAVGTGIIDDGTVGGVLSINALDNTKFDISAGRGLHVDLENNDTEIIEWTACVSCTPTYLNTHLISWIAIDKNAQIVQKSSAFTPEERRDYIVLGILVHVNKTFIDNINMTHYPSDHIVNQLVDMSEALGFMQISGNLFSSYTTDLQMKKTEGTIWKTGSNYHNDIHNPHLLTLSTLNPLVMQYRFQDGTNYTGLSQATVIPTLYESSAGVASSVSANEPWTVQRIYVFTSNNVKLMFGQTAYKTLPDAVAGLSSDPFVVEPSIQANGLFRCYLVINKDCTNLADSATCKFIHAGKFGDIGGASGAGTTTLQEAYNNSGTQNPQILTTATGGAIKLKNYQVNAPSILECYDENASLNLSLTRTGMDLHSLGTIVNCALLDFYNFTTTSTTVPSHIDLWGSLYGFGVGNGSLRYYTDGTHDFYSEGSRLLTVDNANNKVSALSNAFHVEPSSGNAAIEVKAGSSAYTAYIDFSVDNTDYDSRVRRYSNINGNLEISNRGSGYIQLKANLTTVLQVETAQITAFYEHRCVSGTVSKPAYSFTNSTSSGMWVDALDRLCFSAGGNRRLVLDDDDSIYFLFGTGSSSTNYYMTTTAFLPWTDNARNLGSAAQRFDDIYATNPTIQTSDIRLKKDITDINLGLSFINKLRPVSYKWKDTINVDEEGVETVKTHSRPHYGLIAQELEESMESEGVSINDNDILCNDFLRDGEGTDRYGMRYVALIPVLIKSIQELTNRVVELERR